MNKKLLATLLTTITISFTLYNLTPITAVSPKNIGVAEKNIKNQEVLNKSVVISNNKVINKINIRVSYYTNNSSDCGKTDGISASGKHLPTLSRGGIRPIAAPINIPFGTKLYINGIGNVEVEDRGGAIKYVIINGVKYMKVDVFIPNATSKKISDMGIVYTTGYYITK